MMDRQDRLSFVVPTGNFGNVYAGYVAQSMGVPIEKLIVATNKNDILYRFFQTGEMKANSVTPTLSPSMDIQISSNFERLLFDLYGRDGAAVVKTMDHFKEGNAFKMDTETMARLHVLFDTERMSDDETAKIIKDIHEKTGYLSDPHTAVGIGAALKYHQNHPHEHLIALATADPAKFPDAVMQASGICPKLPNFLSDLYQRDEDYKTLPNDLDQVKSYIRQNITQVSAT
jgi:threonine synthase